MAAIKAGLAKIGAAIGAAGSALLAAFEGASLLAIIKVGITIGVSIATVIAIIKYLKNKKKAWSEKKNETVTDEALDFNYADARKQRKLHPVMKKVKKNLTKDVKVRAPRNDRQAKMRRASKAMGDLLDKVNSTISEKYNLRDDFESFLREMEEEEEMERSGLNGSSFEGSLRRIWD